jgi:hypothetical protein
VIDPSGYYNLANPPEKAESAEKVDDDKSSSTFVANFFGLPAILLVVGLILGFKNAGKAIPVIKMLIFLTLSWFLFEVIAYTVMILSVSIITVGVVLMPILGAIAMYIFLRMTGAFYAFKFRRGYWLYSLVTFGVLILPLLQFFIAFQASVVASLSILLWQIIVLWAVYESEQQAMLSEPINI